MLGIGKQHKNNNKHLNTSVNSLLGRIIFLDIVNSLTRHKAPRTSEGKPSGCCWWQRQLGLRSGKGKGAALHPPCPPTSLPPWSKTPAELLVTLLTLPCCCFPCWIWHLKIKNQFLLDFKNQIFRKWVKDGMRESLVKLKKLYCTERIINHCHYWEMIRLFFMQNSCIQNKSLWSRLGRMSESHCRFSLITCLPWSSFHFSCITAVMNSKEIGGC